jgi:hypothetical protein
MTGRLADTAAAHWLQTWVAAELATPAIELLTRELNAHIVAEVPQLAADAGLLSELESSSRETMGVFLPALVDDPRREIPVPPAARDLARAFAHRRLELAELLKVYRGGQDFLWRRIMTAVGAAQLDDSARMQVLNHVWEHVTVRVTRATDTMVATYTEESERNLRGTLALRMQAIQALLAGENVDLDMTGQTLRHSLRGLQTALVLWAADGEHDALARLESLAQQIASGLGAQRAVTVPSTARGLWAWIATDRPPTHTRLPGLKSAADLRAAVGLPSAGPEGFRRSHQQALEAQRVAIATRTTQPITLYQDVELAALLSKDSEVMRELVARELAGLASGEPQTRKLRDTARTYLAAACNARIAADTLGLHKNTVLYRIARVEELLGHPIAERRLQLELALLLADQFGDQALP